MAHSCITPPWEEGSCLTSGCQSVRYTTLQPGGGRYTFPMFSLTPQWPQGSLLWCYSQVTYDTKMAFSHMYTMTCPLLSNEIPYTSPFSLLLTQGHSFLRWLWAHQVVLNQLLGPFTRLVYRVWIHISKAGSHPAWQPCFISHTSTRCLISWTVCVHAKPPLFFNLTTIPSAPNGPKHSCEVTN